MTKVSLQKPYHSDTATNSESKILGNTWNIFPWKTLLPCQENKYIFSVKTE